MNWNMMNRKFLRPVLHTALVAALAISAAAQGGDKSTSVSKVERKGKAPVSKEVLEVKLPKPVKATLKNGMRVLIIEDHRLPYVTVQMTIAGAGPLYDPKETPGLASMTAQMVKEGTAKHNSRQLSEAIDGFGAGINASAPFGSPDTVISGSGLSDTFEKWFPLFHEVALQSTFPTDELKKMVVRGKAQLKQQRSSPNFLASERFQSALYGQHPASVVSPTEASLDAMTSELLTKWRDTHYVPQNAILGIAGDVKAATLIPQLEKWFADWKKTDAKEVLPTDVDAATTRKLILVNRPGSVQTNLVLGNVTINRKSEDYIPMVVANRVVGGGPASRFFLNLREEKGYTYGAYSSLGSQKYRAPWRAFSEVRTDVTEGALKEFLYEINRMREQDVPAAELEEAKHSVVSSFALSLESPAEVLGYAITSEMYGFPADYWDTYPKKVMAVTTADLKRVSGKYLSPDSMQIIAVGDGAKIQPILEKLGTVEVFDTDGKLVSTPAASATPTNK